MRPIGRTRLGRTAALGAIVALLALPAGVEARPSVATSACVTRVEGRLTYRFGATVTGVAHGRIGWSTMFGSIGAADMGFFDAVHHGAPRYVDVREVEADAGSAGAPNLWVSTTVEVSGRGRQLTFSRTWTTAPTEPCR